MIQIHCTNFLKKLIKFVFKKHILKQFCPGTKMMFYMFQLKKKELDFISDMLVTYASP